MSAHAPHTPIALYLLIAGAAAAVGLAKAFRRRFAQGRRRRELGWFAHVNGCSLDKQRKPAEREDWMNCYLFHPAVSNRRALLNVLRGASGGRRWILFDFELRTTWGTGQRSPVRDFTGAAIELRGKALPGFVLFRRSSSFSAGPVEAAHLPAPSFPPEDDLPLGDAAFADRYSLQSKSPEAARRLFGPGLRRLLLEDRRTWFLEGGGDWLVAYYSSDGAPRPAEQDLADVGRIADAFT